MNFSNIVAVGIGGMLGSISRYLASKAIDERIPSSFPYGTFCVNVLGSLVLGVIFAATLRKGGLDQTWRLLLATGFCGGFTTFSTFALENFNLIHQRASVALIYMLLSVIAGLLAIAAGFFGARSLF